MFSYHSLINQCLLCQKAAHSEINILKNRIIIKMANTQNNHFTKIEVGPKANSVFVQCSQNSNSQNNEQINRGE